MTAPPLPHSQHGLTHTPEASRILQRLCYHFQRKISVQYDEHQGLAQFPWGLCSLRAEGDALHFHCQAASAQELARVCHVINEHIALFSRKNPLSVQWQPASVQSESP